MSILDKMEAALKPFAAVFDEFRIRGMDMDEVYLWVGDSTSGQKIKVSFGDCFRARETLREYESLKGQIAVVPVQTSEARKAALKRLNMIQAAYVCAKAVIEKKSLDETDSCDDLFELIRAALRQPDTSEAVREWQPIETAPKNRSLILGYFYELGKWRTVRGRYINQGEMHDECEDPIDGEGWFEEAVNADDLPNVWEINPSHWMPLPEAPAVIAAMKGEA